MFSSFKRLVFTAACVVISLPAQAATLFEQSPAAALGGVQSDASTPPPYLQSFPALTGATLDRLTWWGFHLEAPADANQFEVFLGGNLLAGVLSANDTGVDTGAALELYQYNLDIPDLLLTSADTTLEIWNNSDDVQWAWQYAEGSDTLTAFRLEGSAVTQAVPEPGMLALFGMAVLALSLVRRARG